MRAKAKPNRLWWRENQSLLVSAFWALALLTAAGTFLGCNYFKDRRVTAALVAQSEELRALRARDPFPSRANLLGTREQQLRVGTVLSNSRPYFTPVWQYAPLDSAGFKRLLETTLYELKRKAKSAGVALPHRYSLTFKAQRGRMQFAPGTLGPLAAQLADIKALCTILFDARAHALERIRRARVSPDDPQDSPDFLAGSVHVNHRARAIVAPYEIQFRAFSEELAAILNAFQRGPHGFVIRSLSVQRLPEHGSQNSDDTDGELPTPNLQSAKEPAADRYQMVERPPEGHPILAIPNLTVARLAMPTKRPVKVLDESPLRITLRVDAMRLMAAVK